MVWNTVSFIGTEKILVFHYNCIDVNRSSMWQYFGFELCSFRYSWLFLSVPLKLLGISIFSLFFSFFLFFEEKNMNVVMILLEVLLLFSFWAYKINTHKRYPMEKSFGEKTNRVMVFNNALNRDSSNKQNWAFNTKGDILGLFIEPEPISRDSAQLEVH